MKIPILSFLKTITQIAEKNIFCSYNNNNNSAQQLDFSKLHVLQQEAINKMAEDVYASYIPRKWYKKISCFEKIEFEHKEESAFTVYMLEFIKENCHDCRNIFRFEKEFEDLDYCVRKLSSSSFFPYSTYSAMENATIIKGYLRRGLDGLLPLEISKVLCNAFSKDYKRDFDELISWFPFVIDTNEYRFLTEAIEMFKEIDRHHEHTLMTFNSLVYEFAPLLFPKEIYKAFPDLDFKKLAEHIFSCDFNKVPPINYDKIKDLGKEVDKKKYKKKY